MEGYKTLKCFQRVTYDVEHGKNGRHAVNIIPGEAPKPQK
jgi:CspA family cold shock protein